MAGICVPATLLVNSVYFCNAYYASGSFFAGASLLTFLELMTVSVICGAISVLLQKRFPQEAQLTKKLSFTVITFLLISIFFKYVLFKLYAVLPVTGTTLNEARLTWVCISISILTIFLTFLTESINRFKAWKTTLQDTELLDSAYRQSQLRALKSQVNPHFLFNSLNSLSSLIEENEEKAERFLEELTKVYRHLLHNDKAQLVPLKTELNFLNSYCHVLGERFGAGLQVQVDVTEADQQKLIAPLLLQMITENACSQNVIEKAKPLIVNIRSAGHNVLHIINNIQPKYTAPQDVEKELDAVIKKYRSLGSDLIISYDTEGWRLVCIPLLLSN